jgi:hypothetical protein
MQEQQIRLSGRFTVKEGLEDRLSLVLEAGPGPMGSLNLESSLSLPRAQQLASDLNRSVNELVLDFSYSPAAKLGFGPLRQE